MKTFHSALVDYVTALCAVTIGAVYSTGRVPPQLQALYEARHQGLAMSRADEHAATALRAKGCTPTIPGQSVRQALVGGKEIPVSLHRKSTRAHSAIVL